MARNKQAMPGPLCEQQHKNLALCMAAKEGSLSGIKAALADGADINGISPLPADDGGTALYLACSNSHWQAGAYLLNAGADMRPGRVSGFWNAFEFVFNAMSWRNDEAAVPLISLFFDKGYKPEPFHFSEAARTGHFDLADKILTCGIGVDDVLLKDIGNTALMHLVSVQGKVHEGAIAYLLDKGADPFKKCEEGRTAVDWALREKNIKAAEEIKRFVMEKPMREAEKARAFVNAIAAVSTGGIKNAVPVPKLKLKKKGGDRGPR